jgi:predicted ATPase/class 3 adenylate cyclase
VNDRPDPSLRQLTILFVDIVGSTALNQRLDPEDFREIMDGALRRFTALVTARSGRVLQYAGDNILAAFGIAESAEDDAERAVRAALDIVAEAARIDEQLERQFGWAGFGVRAGLDTGTVLLGEGVDGPNMVWGVAVNLAARMEQSAPVGGIRISQHCFRHVQGVFDVLEEAPLSAKGFDEPIRNYVVRSALSPPQRWASRGAAGSASAFIGRDAELGRLQQAFETVLRKRTPAAFTIVGDPGIGKSRLVLEFDRWLKECGGSAYQLLGSTDRRTRNVPYALLRNLLVRHFDILDSDSLPTALTKLSNGFVEVVGERGAEHAALIGHLIGLDFSADAAIIAMAGDSAQLQHRALDGLANYLRLLCTRTGRPVVLMLDDLQWADGETQDALDRLGAACRGAPLLMLCTARPAPEQPCRFPGRGEMPHERLDLAPLSPESCARLADSLLGGMALLPRALHDRLTAHADGNPYFVEETLHMMIDEGAIVRRGTTWAVVEAKTAGLRVPTTLTALLQARLDALPAAERSLLQKASVVGYVFWDEPLRRVDEAVHDRLASLHRNGLVLDRMFSSIAGAREHVFKHHVLHQVAYEGVLKRQKRELHRLTAEWLVERNVGRAGEFHALIADHFDAAGETESAVAYLRRAAADAAKVHAHDAAVGFLERALRLAPARGPEARYELIKARVSSLFELSRRDEELADILDLERLADALDEDSKRAWAHAFHARHAVFTGNDRAGEALAEDAVRLAISGADATAELLALSVWASACLHKGDLAGTERIAMRLLGRAAEAESYKRNIDALHLLGAVSLGRGRLGAARDHFERALSLARSKGDRLFEAMQLHNVAEVEFELGRYAIAREHLGSSLHACVEVGLKKVRVHVLAMLARTDIHTGAPNAALGWLDQTSTLVQELQNPALEAWLLAIRGDAYALLGQTEDAAEAYRISLSKHEAVEQADSAPETTQPIAGLAKLALARGDIDAALRYAQRIETAAAMQDSDVAVAYELLTCFEVRTAAGESAAARQCLARAYEALMARADMLEATDRIAFLSRVPRNAAIVAAADGANDDRQE